MGLPAVATAADGDVELISRAITPTGAKGLGSTRPSVSADGRYVAFVSGATNLDPADTDPGPDVYLRDTVAGTTTLVSRGAGAGAKANDASDFPSLSADGRYVAFSSLATNLDAADTDAAEDIYLRDTVARTTTLVSRGAGGTKANRESAEPSVSADGRYVAFRSTATNLDPDDIDTTSDVFRRDLSTGTTTLVSRATGAGVKGTGDSAEPTISGDGSRVAFQTNATDLVPGDVNGQVDVVVRDVGAQTTTLVSRATGATGAAGDLGSQRARISRDGRRVAFDSGATTLDPADTDDGVDVFLRDLAAATTTLVSRAPGAAGARSNGPSIDASISTDGRRVAFISQGTNLDPADRDAAADVYVRDLETGAVALANRAAGATGAKGDASSSQPSLQGDGSRVAFVSGATNLSPDDTDTVLDVYRRRVLDPPAAQGTPGTPGATTPAVASPLPVVRDPARLVVRRLGVRRADRRLDLLARITDRATGRVQVRFRAAGTTTRLDVPIEDGRVRAKLPLPARQARLGTGIATIVYPGSPTVRAQKVRLRAASRPARLTARRPTLVAGRLATRGTIARTAAGVVRVELSYANAAGTLRTRRYKARIEDGRWSLRQGLDRRTRDELATRRGVVVADVAYTGRLATRTRGELLSYQVLPAR